MPSPTPGATDRRAIAVYYVSIPGWIYLRRGLLDSAFGTMPGVDNPPPPPASLAKKEFKNPTGGPGGGVGVFCSSPV